MRKLLATPQFKRDVKSLPKEIIERTDELLPMLATNPTHSSLQQKIPLFYKGIFAIFLLPCFFCIHLNVPRLLLRRVPRKALHPLPLARELL